MEEDWQDHNPTTTVKQSGTMALNSRFFPHTNQKETFMSNVKKWKDNPQAKCQVYMKTLMQLQYTFIDSSSDFESTF